MTDPRQKLLFPLGDLLRDSLRADVEATGGLKSVAAQVWPDMNPVAAAKKLSNALNPNQSRNDLTCEDAFRIIVLAVNAHGRSQAFSVAASKLPCELAWITREEQSRRRAERVAATLEALQAQVLSLQQELSE